jgi:cytochrome P450
MDDARTTPLPYADLGRLPGPRAWPLLGNLPDIELPRIHQQLEAWAREYGPVFKVRLGRKTIVCVTDLAAIRQILRDRPRLFSRSKRLEPVFRELGVCGVFAAEGESWKRQRQLWSKALNVHQIAPFLRDMEAITVKLQGRWSASAGQPLDVQQDLMRYTVDVVTRFAFGFDGNTLEREGDVIQHHLEHIFPMVARRVNAPFPYWQYLPLPADRRLMRELKAVRAFVEQRIAEARARIAADPALAAAPGNLIEAFIVSRDDDDVGLSDDEIYANTITALLAGEDTTANTLAWMIHFLALNPAAQQRLHEEATHGEGDSLTRWIDALTGETLRLKPVAPLTGGTALEEVELAGQRFPAGTDFLIPHRVNALDEGQFAQADSFRPERWLEPAQPHFIQSPPMPFGAGQRMCPGRNLAQAEIKAVATMLGRHFTIRPADGGPPVQERYGFTMGPENLRVLLQPRG